jgi:catechol 2,3-dioxygenase-like lactoylglutathione lyase family enzyme
MDLTIRFWRDLLGMRLVAGLGKPGYRHYFFEIDENNLIAFFEWPQAESVPEKDHGYPVVGPVVFDHVSIGVETEEDLWEVKDKLAAAGFEVSEVIDHGFIYSIYAFDPNGIPIEFSYSLPQVDIRKAPLMVDKEPSEATREGPSPVPGRWPAPLRPTPAGERVAFPGQGKELTDPDKQTW